MRDGDGAAGDGMPIAGGGGIVTEAESAALGGMLRSGSIPGSAKLAGAAIGPKGGV